MEKTGKADTEAPLLQLRASLATAETEPRQVKGQCRRRRRAGTAAAQGQSQRTVAANCEDEEEVSARAWRGSKSSISRSPPSAASSRPSNGADALPRRRTRNRRAARSISASASTSLWRKSRGD